MKTFVLNFSPVCAVSIHLYRVLLFKLCCTKPLWGVTFMYNYLRDPSFVMKIGVIFRDFYWKLNSSVHGGLRFIYICFLEQRQSCHNIALRVWICFNLCLAVSSIKYSSQIWPGNMANTYDLLIKRERLMEWSWWDIENDLTGVYFRRGDK